MTELATVAREISSWCEKRQHEDLPHWRDITALLESRALILAENEVADPALAWQRMIAAAQRAMDRRRAAALAEKDGTPRRGALEQRFADAWAIRRALEHSAWKAGHCFTEIAA